MKKINLLAILKTAKLELFSVYLTQIRVVGGVPRCFMGSQFFVTSLWARNSIPVKKLFAILKTAE